jgi:hypothetical protein
MTDTKMNFSLGDAPLDLPNPKQETEKKVTSQRQFDLKGLKLYIAIPCHDFKLHLDTVVGLLDLKEKMLQYGVIGHIQSLGGSALIDKARSDLIAHFLRDSDADYFMFIDSDVGFTGDHVLRLLSWLQDPDIDMVSGAYPAKVDQGPTGKFFVNADFNEEGFPIVDGRGLLKVNAMGLGFCIIPRNVLVDMWDHYPELRFGTEEPQTSKPCEASDLFLPFIDSGGNYWGEDTAFFIRAAAAGFDNFYVDINIDLTHVGRKVYTGDVAKALTDSFVDIQRGGGDRHNPFSNAVKEIDNATT